MVETGAAHALLAHRHGGNAGWPWPYRAEQRFALADDGLEAALTMTSKAREPMPLGLGFHPYFPIGPETRLQFRARRMWLTDADMLRTDPAPAHHFADWASGAPVAGERLIDNAFEDWDGAARLDGVELTAEGAGALHLYAPPGEGFCCIEPVSHLPDAFNRDDPEVLAPGETRTLVMRVRVAE